MVDYLGHTVSKEGLMSDTKVEAIMQAPAPRDVLGLVNYYGKFLPDLATILSPLYVLLQKSQNGVPFRKKPFTRSRSS